MDNLTLKKGQVTIFIILAIFIVAGAILFFILRESSESIKSPSVEIESVVVFVQECIESKGEEALFFIGQHGGYYFTPEPSTSTGVPYYFINQNNFFPSKEKIQDEFSQYLNEALPECTDDFTKFENFVIDEGEIETEVFISKEKVILDVNYPLKISKGEEVFLVEEFHNIEILINLYSIYDIAEFIFWQHVQNTNKICISCLLNIQNEKDFQIIANTEGDTIIYSIIDTSFSFDLQNNLLEPESYKFMFAIEL